MSKIANRKVAALYVCRKGPYYQMDGVDCFDVDRDARTFARDMPVVAHPPCRLWGCLSHLSSAPIGEKQLAVHAVEVVRECGGVLEHPFSSRLWARMKMSPSRHRDWSDGWTMQVDQYHWGHGARKRTWLYIVGATERDIPYYKKALGEPTMTLGHSTMSKKEMKKADRHLTPPKFAEWLVELARRTRV